MAGYLVVDAIRLSDLGRMDTTAQTLQEAKAAAEDIARKYGTRVYILGVVGEVEGMVDPHWVVDPEPAPTYPSGYFGFIPTMP